MDQLPGSDNSVVRIYRARDYVQHGIHFLAATGMTVAAGYWAGFETLACCAALSSLDSFRQVRKYKREFNEIKNPRYCLSGAESIRKIVSSLSHKLCAKEPHIADVNKIIIGDDYDGKLRDTLKNNVYCGMSSISPPALLVSPGFLKLIDTEKEQQPIIAHEFAHYRAKHSEESLVMNGLKQTSNLTAMFGLWQTVFHQGWKPVALSIIGASAVGFVGSKLVKLVSYEDTKDDKAKRPATIAKLGIKTVSGLAQTAILSAPNPAVILPAILTFKGFTLGSGIIYKSLIRRQEFQADRGAVAMGASPLALITSLRKITTAIERDEPQLAALHNWRQGSVIQRGVNMAGSVMQDHPDIQRRCRRLAKLAASKGSSAAEIEKALLAKVDISSLPPKLDNFDIEEHDFSKEHATLQRDAREYQKTLPRMNRRGQAPAARS